MRKKLSSNRIEQILDNARTSLSMEGMEVTEVETEIVRKYLLGIYTEKDVLNIIAKTAIKVWLSSKLWYN